MNYTTETLAGLRAAVADSLDCGATVADIRRRVRQQADGARRFTRRPGDPESTWHRGPWPISVGDVLAVEAEQGAYGALVERWAHSVCETLDAAQR
jgi:hypothetical protein